MKRGRGSDTDVEVMILPTDPALPPIWALAIAMYESKQWCDYVDKVRASYYMRIIKEGRSN